MPDPVAQAKRALRAQIAVRRASLTPEQHERAGVALRARLDALVDAAGARTVTCFLSTPTEPDTLPFITAAVERGIRVLVPVTPPDGPLDWAEVTPDAELVTARFGLREPDGERLGPRAVDAADLMLIPAAAVDVHGQRLGWGRGYYDQTLDAMAHRPPAYAVVHDDDVLDEVPHHPHDQPITGVVTPARTLTF